MSASGVSESAGRTPPQPQNSAKFNLHLLPDDGHHTCAMSSDRVKVLSDLYRFATGLLWGEVSRPDEAQTATGCDQATIDEQNDLDFLRFEAAIPSLPGVYDQLNEATWDQIFDDKHGREEDLDIRPLAQIETSLANQLKRFDSRVRELLFSTEQYVLKTVTASPSQPKSGFTSD